MNLDAVFSDYFSSQETYTSSRVRLNHFAKRSFDIFFSGSSLLLLSPIIGLSAFTTLCDTGRPVFFSQERRGYRGEKFRVYKMRSMYQDTEQKEREGLVEKEGKFQNIPTDSSVYTRVGRYLEKFWIVEFPQFWNVLKGEMSIVGNRPIPDYVFETLGTSDDVLERFGSPPGLTGYSQVIGRYEISDQDRIKLEKEYSDIYRHGDVFIEDLRIILMTMHVYFSNLFDKNNFLTNRSWL